MTSTATPGPLGLEDRPDGPGQVLAAAQAAHRARMRADAEVLVAACAWADLHPVRPGDPGATLIERFGDTGLTVAGPGAPLVEEFAVPAFAARLGVRSEAGATLIGEALELRHRLPRLWARVQACEVEAWRARRIAQSTIRRQLSVAAAGFVDAHLAPVAQSAGLPTIDRCVDEAMARWMPSQEDPDAPSAEEDEADGKPHAPDPRCFAVDKRQVSFAGTLECHGTLDLADALAVDEAVRAEMNRLRALGAHDAHGPLSAAALTALVTRRDHTLDDLDPTEGDGGGLDTPASSVGGHSTTEGDDGDDLGGRVAARAQRAGVSRPASAPVARRGRDRTILLHLHLSATAVTGTGTCPCGNSPAVEVGRVEETRAPVTADQVRAWCGAPATTHIRVLPVLDLDQRSHVEQYEMPDRIRTQAALTALTCVFPWCTRPARGCDTDHVEAHDPHPEPGAEPADQRGPTASDNAAPLCRRHHRLKTHAPARHRWHLTQLDHGTWLWRPPPGAGTPRRPVTEYYLRDHHGTHVVPVH